MAILVGTHECDVVDTTTSHATTGAFSFSTAGGTIDGVTYKSASGDGVVLPSCTVYLLQSQSDSKYAVMVDDEFWGCRIGPYPPAAAPFTENLEMGFLLNARFQIDDVYTDDERLTLVFTAVDENSGLTCRFVWGGGEGVNLLTSARESAIVSDTVAAVVGTVRHNWPANEKLVFPNGEGAACQRYVEGGLADYRDDSSETAAEGFRWYVTAATLYYSDGDSSHPYVAHWSVPLDGTATTFNYKHGSISITGGRAGAFVDVYSRSANTTAFQDGWLSGVALDGSGEATITDLPAGEFILFGYEKDNGNYTYRSAPVVAQVVWGQTTNSSVPMDAYSPDVDDLYWGWWLKCPGEPLVGATVNAWITVWDGGDRVDCYVEEIGTTDANGYGPTGHDGKEWESEGLLYTYEEVFVDDSAGILVEHSPWRVLGARVVLPEPRLALIYAGTSEYEHLQGRHGAWHLEAGDYCPPGYGTVEMHLDEENGWMYSDPVPWFYDGAWDPCTEDDPSVECEWEVWAGGEYLETVTLEAAKIGDTIHTRNMENDAGNHELGDYTVAGRIRGSHVDWSAEALTTPEHPVDMGLEFGEYTTSRFRAIAELNDPPDSDPDYGHSAGHGGHVCYYCGIAAKHDPADGAARWFCPQGLCGRDSRAYWDVFPCAEDPHHLHVVTPTPQELGESRVERQAWYRPEDVDNTSAYEFSPTWPYRYVADHVVLATWDHATGFSAGTGMAERGVAVSRGIGPAQPKLKIVEASDADVEVRLLCERTDDSEAYFYATVTSFAQVGDIVPMSYVLRDTGDPQSSRRALALIYESDLEGWPCVSGDAVDECTNAWAWDGDSWETTAGWLSSGQWEVVNDNPSYRHTSILVERAEVSPYVAQLYVPTPSLGGDLRRDYAGRIWIAGVDEGGDLYVTHIPHELQGPVRWVLVSDAREYANPSICPLPDGRLLLAVQAATVLFQPTGVDGALQPLATYVTELRLTKNDGEDWEVIDTPHLADDLELVYIWEQHNTGVVYAVGVDSDVVYVEYSTDQGASKAEFRTDNGTVTRKQVTTLTVTGVTPKPAGECCPDGALLVSTEDDNGAKLWKSRDRGESWTQVT